MNGQVGDGLRLEGIVAGYGTATVLQGVSLAAPAGSVTALVGPNGAGKTTLLRVAAGLLHPREGRVRLDGLDVTGVASHRLARRGLCLVPEGRGIFPNLTVRENLLLHARRGEESAALELAVSAFPALASKLAQPAGTLSGGEQQMVALSRVHVTEASVVLVDEASMGLAPLVVEQIFEFLAAVAGAGPALLLVEQYVDRALEMADYVYVLGRGQIVFAGEPSELEGTSVFDLYLGRPTASH